MPNSANKKRFLLLTFKTKSNHTLSLGDCTCCGRLFAISRDINNWHTTPLKHRVISQTGK